MTAWRTPRSYLLDLPAGRVHAECLGDPRAPALVLLHDGGGAPGGAPWPEGLRRLVCGTDRPLHLLRWDRRGYGLSGDRPEGFPPDFFLRDLADFEALLDRLLPGQPLRLAGTSDGGTIALLYAAKHPQRVRALAVDGAHHRIHPDLPAGLEGMWRRFTARHGEEPAGPEPMALRTARAWFAGWGNLVRGDWSIVTELARIRCPLWVLQGEWDGIVPDAYAVDLAASTAGPSRWEILPGGAHLCQRSHPRQWTDWLRRFLSQTPY
jgi:pimeloyl-ACP methyl ester carboxylesterase